MLDLSDCSLTDGGRCDPMICTWDIVAVGCVIFYAFVTAVVAAGSYRCGDDLQGAVACVHSEATS